MADRTGRSFIDRMGRPFVRDGVSKDPAYRAWAAMIMRCVNPKVNNYHSYGGRGITVCNRWRDFRNFIADMGPRPSSKHTIERRNNDLGYDADNCYWATRFQQSRNTGRNKTITVLGIVLILKDAAIKYGIIYSTLCARIRRGISIEDAFQMGLLEQELSNAR